MKKLISIIMLLLSVLTLAACNNEGNDSPTLLSTAAPSTVSTSHFVPSSRLDDMVAAYNAYITMADLDHPITNIIFDDGKDCFIITENQKVYPFFREGATNSAKVHESMKFTLYYAPSLEDVMVQAMQNAWNAYSAKCAEDRTTIYDRQLYLFQCSYFDGVFGIDENNQLQRDRILEGINCGTYGAFTIYVPENADQSQQGNMTDGEIKVIITNVYNKFATQSDLDGNTCQPMEHYIYEKDGVYYRTGETLERLDSTAVSELAMDIAFDGWQVYLPVETASSPDHTVLQQAYNAFVAKAKENKVKYKDITEYLFFDGTNYFAIDEWNNVTTVDGSKAGKVADKTEFDGFLIYKTK